MGVGVVIVDLQYECTSCVAASHVCFIYVYTASKLGTHIGVVGSLEPCYQPGMMTLCSALQVASLMLTLLRV